MSTAIFLGAGASTEFDIPALRELTNRIVRMPGSDGDEIRRLRRLCADDHVSFNVETLLTFLETSANRVPSFQQSGALLLALCQGRRKLLLRSSRAHDKLARRVKISIRNQCYVKREQLYKVREIFESFLGSLMQNEKLDLGPKIPRSKPTYPLVDFFTTNYDDVIETFYRIQGIEATDGYRQAWVRLAGQKRPTYIFDENLFENPSSAKIHKLYGSIMYACHTDGLITQIEPNLWETSGPDADIQDLLIYPGATKIIWNEPQLQLFNRLLRVLRTCTAFIVIGYSFSDQAVKGVILNAMRVNPSLRIFVVNTDAKEIVRDLFDNNKNVKAIPTEFRNFEPKTDIRF